MAQPWVSGPVHIYVSFDGLSPFAYPAKSDIKYLGMCEQAPQRTTVANHQPLMTDATGPAVPYDQMFVGETGIIAGQLVVWNEVILNLIRTRPFFGGTPGTFAAGSIGTLLLTEGYTMHLWLMYQYYSKAIFGGDGATVRGYHYPCVTLVGPDQDDLGAKINRRHVQFQAWPAFKLSDGTSILYDTTMTSIPLYPPTANTGTLS